MNLDSKERKTAYENLKMTKFPMIIERKATDGSIWQCNYTDPLNGECIIINYDESDEESVSIFYPKEVYAYYNGMYDELNNVKSNGGYPLIIKYDFENQHWIEVVNHLLTIRASSKSFEDI